MCDIKMLKTPNMKDRSNECCLATNHNLYGVSWFPGSADGETMKVKGVNCVCKQAERCDTLPRRTSAVGLVCNTCKSDGREKVPEVIHTTRNSRDIYLQYSPHLPHVCTCEQKKSFHQKESANRTKTKIDDYVNTSSSLSACSFMSANLPGHCSRRDHKAVNRYSDSADPTVLCHRSSTETDTDKLQSVHCTNLLLPILYFIQNASVLLRLSASVLIRFSPWYQTRSSFLTSKPSRSSILFSLRCLLFITSFLLCTGSIHAQSWENPPLDSSALKGSSVTLLCGIRNLGNNTNIQWIQYDGDNTNILFLNGANWGDAPDRYSVAPHTAGGSGVSGYDLTLSGLLEEDDNMYECAVQHLGERQAKVTVLVVPGTPVLEVENLSDLTEGDLVTLTCTTSGGNPQPEITWYRMGDELTGAQVTPPSEKFGTTRSVLTYTMTRHDHQVEFRCSVENDANVGNPDVTRQTLAVKYAPVMDLGPFNPLRVVETSVVTLRCDVSAYPAVTGADVQWLDSQGISLGFGFEYTFQGVSKSHAGMYRCRAENVVDVTLADLELDVHYEPKVMIHHSRGQMFNGELSIHEATPLNLTCVVDANPSVDLSTVVWKRDNVPIHTGSYYYTSSIHRSDSGEYSCTAGNTLSPSDGPTQPGTGMDSVQVIVQYKPGRATVIVPEETIKYQRIEITCSVDDLGFPEATLEWTVLGSSTILQEGPTMTFDPLELSDTNDYICTPTNEVGDGQHDTQRLDVLELPEWLNSLPLTTETNIDATAFSLACEVRGQPRPQVTWYWDDEPVSEMKDYFTVVEHKKSIDVYSWNVTSVLQWKGYKRSPLDTSLLPSDSGMYRCHVTSDIAVSPLSATTQLSVYYPPIVNTSSDKVAADANGAATLECRAHSLPGATFVWYNGTERVQSGGRVQITDSNVGGEFPFETSLSVSNIQSHDFSTYTCQASNTLGITERQISLTVKTVPDPPTSLRIHSKTWESVELSWQPGFDGGYTQHFVVSYTSMMENPGQEIVDGANRLNVTMLYPSTNYSFHIIGRNQLGVGEESAAVATETEFFIIESPTSIQFNPDTYTVSFDSPSTYYCARVDVYDGRRWTNYAPCAPTLDGSVQISQEQEVENVRVALCLETRQDVCSEAEEAIFLEPEQDLPTYVVIIIGVVCAVIVIALTLVLVYLCIRHSKGAKEEEDKEPSSTATHLVQPAATKPLANGHAKLNHSFDRPPSLNDRHGNNPGYQGDERSHGSRSPVFTTDTSQGAFFPDEFSKQPYYLGGGGPPNGGQPTQYQYDNQANLQREHSFKTTGNRDMVDGGGGGLYLGGGQMINLRNHPDKQYLYEDNHNTTKDSHNSGEGSVSSDSKPPKKVMYEVVV